jgi:DNA-binding transcriptional LysR family regulator
MRTADFEGWDLFVAVAEAGSLAGAARARGLSVPTVSRAIARLEARLGGALFHRSTRRLALSSLGQDALAEAQALVAAGQRMEARLGEAQSEPRGVIRLAAPLDFGRAHLAPLLPDFLAAHPGLEVELSLDDARIDIVASGHDLVLRIGRLADSTLIARRLCPVARIPVASPAYLAQAGRPEVPADLTRHACLLYSNVQPPGLWAFEGPGGVKAAVTVTGPLKANSGGALNPALLAGAGIALQPDFLVAEHLATGRLEALLPGWQSPPLGLYLVTPPSPLRPQRVRLLIDFLARRLTPPPRAAGVPDRPAA